MRRTILTLLSASFISGCATLPTDQTTGFQKVSDADRDAFAAIAKTEESSIATRAELLASENPGTYSKQGCDFAFPGAPPPPAASAPAPSSSVAAPSVPTCSITFQRAGDPPLTPVLAAPRTRQLIGAIATYADKMSELATAKDVTAAQTAVDGLASAISGIAIASGAGAPVAVIIQFADVATKEAFIAERRRVLRVAANAAEQPIEQAAATMGNISVSLQQDIEASASDRIRLEMGLTVAEQQLISCLRGMKPMPTQAAFDEQHCESIRHAPDIQRAILEHDAHLRLSVLNADLFKASSDYDDAAALQTDYSGLVKSHQDLLKALNKPGFSPGAALADLNSIVSKLKPSS